MFFSGPGVNNDIRNVVSGRITFFIIRLCTLPVSLIPCHLMFSMYMKDFNSSLAETARIALKQGIMIFPGPATFPLPDSWSAASGSAAFFTLTTGCLSFSTGYITAGLISGKCGSLKKDFIVSALLVLFLSILLVLTGMPGIFPLSFLMTALVSSIFRLVNNAGHGLKRRIGIIVILFVGVMSVMFFFRDSGFFTGIRDRLLFGTETGEWIIDFYYKYNLYPAEIIKKPEYRSFRTINADIADIKDNIEVFHSVRHVFEKKGFVFLSGSNAFYKMSLKNGIIEVISGKKILARVPVETFRDDSSLFFREIYSKSDNATYPRFLVFASFLIGLPFILADLSADFLLSFSLMSKRRFFFIPLLICIFIFILIGTKKNSSYTDNELKSMLGSSDNQKKIEAMNFIIRKKRDPDSFMLPHVIPGKGAPRERILYLYLVSRSGGIRRFETISPFADDPYPYVACQAIRFMSQLRDERNIPVFEKTVLNHSNPYVQFTAMEALKSWKNRKIR